MADKIGFIGLGIMGRPMARNLMKAGYSLVVYDLFPQGVEELKKEGAESASSCKEVAERCPIVITMVPDSADSEAAILGPNGVLEGAKKSSTIIDMSSINPIVSKKIGEALDKAGVAFIDAPVSGGEPGAINATLAIMVGGPEAVFAKCKPILEKLGSTVTLCGNWGAGNVVKLANQIMVAVNIQGVAEALVLCTKAGVDPEVAFKAVQVGLAGSNVLNAKGPMMIARNFKPGFRIRLHMKDINNTMDTARALNVPLPVTGMMQQILVALMNDNRGNDDHSGIVTYLEQLAKIEVHKLS